MSGERMRISRGVLVLGLAALLVAGCSKAGPEREPDVIDNAAEATPEQPAELRVQEEEKAPPPVADPVANTADALPPEEDPSREAQMLEDADATGMTARAARSGESEGSSPDPIGDLVENGGTIAH
jgi:hypothetical protein